MAINKMADKVDQIVSKQLKLPQVEANQLAQ